MKIDRRNFLRAAGISLGLPTLESFGASSEQPSPRRMIAINQDLGFIPKLFFPKGEGREYELSSYLERIGCHRDESPFSVAYLIRASMADTERTSLSLRPLRTRVEPAFGILFHSTN